MTLHTLAPPTGAYTIAIITDAHLTAVSTESDLHPAFRLALKFVCDFQPDVIVLGGDILDMRAISPHAFKASNLKELENMRLGDDYAMLRDILEKLRTCCKAMAYLEGNHENWATRLMERFPGLEGMLDVPGNLGLADLGIKWLEVNKVLRVGTLNFTHGWFVNKYHARKHLDEMGDHIIYGHTHDHQKVVKPVRASREPYLAMSSGCLCDLNPDYKRNRPNEWMHGFSLVEVTDSGKFAAHFIPVLGTELIWDRHIWRL